MKQREKSEIVYIIDEIATAADETERALQMVCAAYNALCELTFGKGAVKLKWEKSKENMTEYICEQSAQEYPSQCTEISGKPAAETATQCTLS